MKPFWVKSLVQRLTKRWALRRILLSNHFASVLSDAGIFIKHNEKGVLVVSNFWSKLGYAWEPEGSAWLDLVHPDDRLRITEEWDLASRGGINVIQSEFRILRSDGVYEWVISKFWVLHRKKNRKIISYVGMDMSLQELKDVQQDFENAANLAQHALEDGESARSLGLEIVGCRTWDEFWLRVTLSTKELISHSNLRILRFEENRVLVANPQIVGERPQFALISLAEGLRVLDLCTTTFQNGVRHQIFTQEPSWFSLLPNMGKPELQECSSFLIVPLWASSRMFGALVFGHGLDYGFTASEIRRIEVYLDFIEPATRTLNSAFLSKKDQVFSSVEQFLSFVTHTRSLKKGTNYDGEAMVAMHLDYPKNLPALESSYAFMAAVEAVHDRLYRLAYALDWVLYSQNRDLWYLYLPGPMPDTFSSDIIKESRKMGFPLGVTFRSVRFTRDNQLPAALLKQAQEQLGID